MPSRAINDFMSKAAQLGMTPQEIELGLFNFIKVTIPIVIVILIICCLNSSKFEDDNTIR